MSIQNYTFGRMDNNVYILVDDATKEAAVVDPTYGSETLFERINEQGLNIRYILNTHAHFDHVVGNQDWVDKYGATLALHDADLPLLRAVTEQGDWFGITVQPSPEPGLLLMDGQRLPLGDSMIEVAHVPGHSPGSVMFLYEGSAIVGDVLFAGSIGRTDLPGASLETLMHTLLTRILTLPDSTPILPGHGKTTTLEQEKRTNPFLQQY